MTEHRRDLTAASAPQAPVPLDPTGVPGLDEVLGGGIQRGSLAILAGPPGSGKTILAHQIAFAAARAGRHTTILTAFSEPTNKLIAHMRPFTFFDQELLGQSLDVFSIQQFLRQGLEMAADEIVGAVRSARARLVILDGFRGVRETTEHPEVARRFIYDVSNRLSLLGVTLLFTSEALVRDVTFFPEATTADVLLGLTFEAIDVRERRTLEVLKVRGAAPLVGLHALTIGDDGVVIFPRLEARVARETGVHVVEQDPRAAATSAETPAESQRPTRGQTSAVNHPAASGVPGLDTLMNGGLTPGTSTLVVGERGTGKTLFGLQFALQGAQAGEAALFVSFRETTHDMLHKAAPFQWAGQLQSAVESGAITVLRVPPIELRPDVLADTVLTRLDSLRARRVVLDEIGEIERALSASGYARRYHDFTAALFEALRRRNITAVFTQQLAEEQRFALERRLGPAGMLAHNLLWLRRKPCEHGQHRSLAILQMSLSSHSDAWHAVSIQAPEGIAVHGRMEGDGADSPVVADADADADTDGQGDQSLSASGEGARHDHK